MSPSQFTAVTPGRLNRPTWHRSHVAEFGPLKLFDEANLPKNP